MKLAPKVMALALTMICAAPAFAKHGCGYGPGWGNGWNGGYGYGNPISNWWYGRNNWNGGWGGCGYRHDNGRHLGWYKNRGYGYAPWLAGNNWRGNWGGRHHHWRDWD